MSTGVTDQAGAIGPKCPGQRVRPDMVSVTSDVDHSCCRSMQQ